MMKYFIGEKVVHSPEGLCVIEDICPLEIEKNTRFFYYLRSVTDASKALYIPVDSSDLKIRTLRSREEIERILLTEPEENLLENLNIQKRINIQNQAIREDDSFLLMRLIKMYRRKQRHKGISVGDSTWLHKAEKYLLSEMAEVMGCEYGSLQKYIII